MMMMKLAMESEASDEDLFWVMGESWKETFTAFLDTSASGREGDATDSPEPSQPSSSSHSPLLSPLPVSSQDSLCPTPGMISWISSIQETLSNLSARVASNETRLAEAECRISAVEDCTLSHDNRIVSLDKEVALLRAKVDDLENRGRRKNLRIVGLPEKAEGSESVAQFLKKMLPKWLDLTPDPNFEIERAHRSLGPIPGENRPPRSVLVRFLRYTDKESVLQAARKKRTISHDGNQLRFFQDVSPDVLKKRREFDDVRKILSAREMFRGFAYPAKLRCLHGTEMHVFSSPAAVTEFLKSLEDK